MHPDPASTLAFDCESSATVEMSLVSPMWMDLGLPLTIRHGSVPGAGEAFDGGNSGPHFFGCVSSVSP